MARSISRNSLVMELIQNDGLKARQNGASLIATTGKWRLSPSLARQVGLLRHRNSNLIACDQPQWCCFVRPKGDRVHLRMIYPCWLRRSPANRHHDRKSLSIGCISTPGVLSLGACLKMDGEAQYQIVWAVLVAPMNIRLGDRLPQFGMSERTVSRRSRKMAFPRCGETIRHQGI